MGKSRTAKASFLKKVFILTHCSGLVAVMLFPLVATPIVGPAARSLPFVISCLAMGLVLGVFLYLFIRTTLKRHLRLQLEVLSPLTGEGALKDESFEGLHGALRSSVNQVQNLVQAILSTLDRQDPHFEVLASNSSYLSERAQEGLDAAHRSNQDVKAMEEKQQEITNQIELLSNRTQDEAALSRQLSASLEEMAGAMDHSTAKFLETTTSVDEMASSILEVAAQTDEIARSVEGTTHDLDAIGDSLGKIRTGASASAEAAGGVKQDAETGLQVVRTSMEEMDRIERESRKATEAMQRLSQQTGEVVKIIEVIKELVSDTELLAFNAAIIAAKAGAEGKGFSVVAEEIRDLADRTTTSAQDIHRIVQAIREDTREVTDAVEGTGQRIQRGKQLSLSTGEALGKIVESSSRAAAASSEIAELTGLEGERARTLLNDAGRSLRSVKAIARAMVEQQSAITRIQEGVTEMKGATDQIARGMEEQVRANREFDRGLTERESQIQAINEVTRFQMATSQRVFAHFATSQNRLTTNTQKATLLTREVAALESLTGTLRQQAGKFHREETPKT
ncbi:MAG: hypothetical protein C0617_13470 [Desulfuromonas sp.]|uniref:methyl-accepting chemotaxis protein n=1 Tax=Desulfuromonas sp. TaxID=892 RepID=UPI000CA94B15|nr:methyl-accepting chemotaxis protein [Desulfuromonas sp.]PLX82652.1 MAG: hypothetical protein C0617_13470 [Desulfuromonas sp.]